MIKKIMLSVLAITVVWIMIWHNLVSNSVYYAKNMPHKEGSEPILVMIMDNHFWLPKPESLIYEEDGGIAVRKNVLEGLPVFVKPVTPISKAEEYFFKNNGITYEYDKNFILYFAYTPETRKNGLDLTTIDKQKVMSEIYELVQPIIDAQTTPLINLQWLFNLLNYDRFN